MGWSIKLGRIFGIDIKMHLTFVLILLWGTFAYDNDGGPLYGLLMTVCLFGIVILHELGHSLAAMFFGISVKDIILLPIGGVARLEKMPEKPWQELIVALAGPAVNVILAILLLPLMVMVAYMNNDLLTSDTFIQATPLGFLFFLLIINVWLVVFNMIPAFPLDGGRVFRATVALFTNYQQATRLAVLTGRGFALLLVLIDIFFAHSFSLSLVALFIYVVGNQEGRAVKVKGVLQSILVKNILTPNRVAFTANATVEQIAVKVMSNHQPNYAILDPDNQQLVGVASNKALAQAMAHGQWYKRVTDIMHHSHHIPKITLNASLAEAQDKLAEHSSKVIAVYDGLDFRGLIDLNDIYHAFQFLSQSQPTPQKSMA